MNSRTLALLVAALLVVPLTASAEGTARRFVLAAGANSGGHGRLPLRYAVSDAAQFADVMTAMGGVEPADRFILEEPDLEEFGQAIVRIRDRIATSAGDATRTEVLFYYSGHADEEGLLLGTERLPYRRLRTMMDEVPADVRITVLDACASGAITRIKGGQRQAAFLVDDSASPKGYAFLTSSSADETAQESDQIGSSFFTHYLVSGMRGAADVSGDGKVSLTEAYEFAFNETLASTTETRGGAQHPAYEINLSGTGDVVMTDLRETSAGLLLTEELGGRFYVRNGDRQLVAELFKPEGRVVELGLEPGTYAVYLAREEELFIGAPTLRAGDRIPLRLADLEPVDRLPTTVRGARPGTGSGVAGRPQRVGGLSLERRHRIELRGGYCDTGPARPVSAACADLLETDIEDLLLGFSYGHWVRERLSIDISLRALVVEARSTTGPANGCETAIVVSSAMFGFRYYPLAGPQSPIRPYVAAAVGPYIGVESTGEAPDDPDAKRTTTLGTFGGHLGGGVDLLLGRHVLLDLNAGYNLMKDFPKPLAGKNEYGGWEVGLGLGILLGGGI